MNPKLQRTNFARPMALHYISTSFVRKMKQNTLHEIDLATVYH